MKKILRAPAIFLLLPTACDKNQDNIDPSEEKLLGMVLKTPTKPAQALFF